MEASDTVALSSVPVNAVYDTINASSTTSYDTTDYAMVTETIVTSTDYSIVTDTASVIDTILASNVDTNIHTVDSTFTISDTTISNDTILATAVDTNIHTVDSTYIVIDTVVTTSADAAISFYEIWNLGNKNSYAETEPMDGFV